MTFRVVLTDKAEADVEAVLKWFRDNQAIAAGGRWFAQLMAKLDSLEAHPDRCARAAESDDIGLEIREILLGRRQYKYRLVFTIRGKTVSILRVWHSSRDSITRDEL